MSKTKKRRPIHKHEAWGVTFGGVYDSSLKLAYFEEEAWAIAAFKCNMLSKKAFDDRQHRAGKVPALIKARLRRRGVGICRVKVTYQQLDV